MSLSANANVRAAANFSNNMRQIRRFFREQDERSAVSRFGALRAALADARRRLSWNPECGRPARLLSQRSTKVRACAARLQELAVEAQLPSLREIVIGSHIVIYAHSEREVRLLAIKHQRQLTYRVG